MKTLTCGRTSEIFLMCPFYKFAKNATWLHHVGVQHQKAPWELPCNKKKNRFTAHLGLGFN